MHTVKIRLRKPRRVFPFLCDDIPLNRDEACIVQSDRGTEWGICVLPPEPCPAEMERRYPMRVLRKAESEDESTYAWLLQEEKRAREIGLQKIKLHNLDMKLVDVECTFDKRRIIYYFTAEDRVDFRELVRDMAHDLRTRIELRHIQVRDEAKMVGGIGGCGRELCCSTWLNEFMPISMRMAKRQNLSLNPSKISGQCGRLLCCLSYENDLYERAKRPPRQSPDSGQASEPRESQPPTREREPVAAQHPQRISSLPSQETQAAPAPPVAREESQRPPSDTPGAHPPSPSGPPEGTRKRRRRKGRGKG